MAGGMTLPDGDANKTRGIQDGAENKAHACKGCSDSSKGRQHILRYGDFGVKMACMKAGPAIHCLWFASG